MPGGLGLRPTILMGTGLCSPLENKAARFDGRNGRRGEKKGRREKERKPFVDPASRKRRSDCWSASRLLLAKAISQRAGFRQRLGIRADEFRAASPRDAPLSRHTCGSSLSPSLLLRCSIRARRVTMARVEGGFNLKLAYTPERERERDREREREREREKERERERKRSRRPVRWSVR